MKTLLIKKHGVFLLPILAIVLLLAFIAAPNKVEKAGADEFEYGQVDVVSIAPPTIREVVSGSLYHFIFVVYFDGDITYANYKHMARNPADLEATIGWANPEITKEAIEFFDENGIISSINDCIYFNGKSVREYEKINFDACMIHLGDLGVNNSMNIEFGSNYVPLRQELDESYTFSFKAGLKLPSGVVLKSDSEWKFVLSDRTFQKADKSVDASDVGFTVNYNGRILTKTDNLVTVSDKKDFDIGKLYVKPNNLNATISVEKTFDELVEGYNYLLISCISENGAKISDDFQVVIKYLGENTSGKKGCSSGISSGICIPLILAAIAQVRRKIK